MEDNKKGHTISVSDEMNKDRLSSVDELSRKLFKNSVYIIMSLDC